MNNEQINYNINNNIRYNHHEKIDIPAIIKENKEQWFNQSLTLVNDSVVRLGIIHGEFHWHKHDTEDEFFYVIDGKLFVDLEDKIIELNQGEGVTVSKGVIHRTRAPQKTIILMVEPASVEPTGSKD
ncbi:MAG: cupin domain-containing protein [Ignavibacteriaceae bacterium]